MSLSNRPALFVVPLIAALAGFWLLLISPKRDQAGELQTQIDRLEASISDSEAQIVLAEAARDNFAGNYAEMVDLGRAVPEGDDQATLVYDVSKIGRGANVEFRDFQVTSAAQAVEPAPQPETTAPPAEGGEGEGESPAPEVPATATEATAATLPIGATVGPAALPVMPYAFKFQGSFFNMADFFGDLERTVTIGGRDPKVSGRLITVDGFAFAGDQQEGFPAIEASFSVTTYLVPPEQGLAAGATPAGPAPVGATGTPTPTSSTTSTP